MAVHSILYLKINSGFPLERIPSNNMFSDAPFSRKWIYVYNHAALDNIPDSLNIRQKLGLFVLGVTHISNVPIVCGKLTCAGGWVRHSDVKFDK